MFTFRSVQGWLIKLAGGLLAVGMMAGLALAPAYAAGNPPKATPAASVLNNLYQREQNWLGRQTTSLTHANTIAANVQNVINTLKGQGKNTATLEAALAAFNSQVAAAQSAHDTAAGILSAHAGFDGTGLVTDRAQAIATLRQAYQSLQSAHKTLSGAAGDLRQALRAFRNAH